MLGVGGRPVGGSARGAALLLLRVCPPSGPVKSYLCWRCGGTASRNLERLLSYLGHEGPGRASSCRSPVALLVQSMHAIGVLQGDSLSEVGCCCC